MKDRRRSALINVGDGAISTWFDGQVSSAPALVLLHGWTLDHRMWGPQVAAFAGDRLVLAPDRRGFGSSTAPPDLSREADDIASLLDGFAVPRAVLVGMSQAGRVALDFALRYPKRLAGIVLQGAPLAGVTPGPAPEETIPIVEYAALVRAGRLGEMKQRWRAHPLMRAASSETQQMTDCILEDYEGRDLDASSYLRDAEPHDLARIRVPALVIAGAHDTPWRRQAADALTHALPNARRIEIADASHLCNLDKPNAFNAALADFLADSST